ncbi:MAG: glycosyltransferase, partial [Deltaproteobacteria bacterium]|nr:glycosyltransferase [Deltaproteobacteria bacterium]
MVALDLALALAAAPVLAASAYLALLAVLARRPPLPPALEQVPRLRFDLLVPAHDEAANIAATVKSLLALDYPASLRRVVVVADNCRDETARLAAEAGAAVWVREHRQRVGKGHALAFAFSRCLAEGWSDAVVVVDADTLVSPSLLQAYSARLEQGARALQADYGVRNPDDSWRTRLAAIAFALFHTVRSLARERLGLSCGLRGNGMCFTTGLLREVPYAAFSLVEDVEYGLRLGEAGQRVWYADEARVYGEMVSTAHASASQR